MKIDKAVKKNNEARTRRLVKFMIIKNFNLVLKAIKTIQVRQVLQAFSVVACSDME